MRAVTFAVLAAVALSTSRLVGQPGVPLPAVPGVPPQYQEMMATMAAAQGAAMRRGDDALSCAALQAEQQAGLNSAAMQVYAAAMQAPGGVPLPGQVTGEVERPGAAQQAAAPVMPLLARQQQVIQLAFLKECAWVTEAGAGFGVPGLAAE